MFELIGLFIKLLILPIKLLIELVELLARVASSGSSRRTSRTHQASAPNSNAGCLVVLGIVGIGLVVALVVGAIHNPRTLLNVLGLAAFIAAVVCGCACGWGTEASGPPFQWFSRSRMSRALRTCRTTASPTPPDITSARSRSRTKAGRTPAPADPGGWSSDHPSATA